MPVTRRRIGVGFLVVALVGLALFVRPDTAMAHLRDVLFAPWFPIVLLGLYAVRPLLGWPITVLSALVGFRYGILVGMPIALAGVVGTSLLPYVAGRRFDLEGPVVRRFVGGSQRYFRTAGDLRGVIAARLAPTPAEPVSIAAGFGGVPLGAFVLGTLVGELPWTIAAVTVGHSLTVFSVADIGIHWELIGAGLLATLLLLSGPLYRAVRRGELRVRR